MKVVKKVLYILSTKDIRDLTVKDLLIAFLSLAIFFFIIFLLQYTPVPEEDGYTETRESFVSEVIDGDTVKVTIDNKLESIRLIGIDTPERGECYFQEATDEMKDLVLDKEVLLEYDLSQGERDKYDRILAYVWVDEINANQEMITGGFSEEYTYDKPYKYQEDFQNEEAKAKGLELGLFGDVCTF